MLKLPCLADIGPGKHRKDDQYPLEFTMEAFADRITTRPGRLKNPLLMKHGNSSGGHHDV